MSYANRLKHLKNVSISQNSPRSYGEKVRWGRKPVGYPENAMKWSSVKGRYMNIVEGL